jgi:hypothetical protein
MWGEMKQWAVGAALLRHEFATSFDFEDNKYAASRLQQYAGGLRATITALS